MKAWKLEFGCFKVIKMSEVSNRMQELSFFDFNNLTISVRQQVETILQSTTPAVEFPWSYGNISHADIPLNNEPSHFFAPGHVMSAPMPMYPCPGPAMVPVLTYPHSVVFNPGAMYMPMVPMATSLSSNGIVSSNLPYNPVTMATVSSAVYPSQPVMMGPIDPHFTSCPVTMACPSGHALVNPNISHDQPVMPAMTMLLPSISKSSDIVAKEALNADDIGTGDISREEKSGKEMQKVNERSSESGPLSEQWPGKSSEMGRADINRPTSRRSSTDVAKLSIEFVMTSGNDVTKVGSGLVSPALTQQPSPVPDTRRSSLTSELATSGDTRNTSNGQPHQQSGSGPPKPKTWASLLRNTASATNAIVVTANDHSQLAVNQKGTSPIELSTKLDKSSGSENINSMAPLQQVKEELMQLLKNHTVSHRSVYLQPRGLTNRSNWCYVNATLQALLACPPFYHLMKQVSTVNPTFFEASNFPAMKCMTQLIAEFPIVSVKSLDKQAVNAKGNVKADIKCGSTFEPVFVHEMLQAIDYEAFKLNQQEDAEEFLSCLLNRLHDEMVNVMKQLEGGDGKKEESSQSALANGDQKNKIVSEDGEDDARWEQVRARNRTVYSSSAGSESSPISVVFRGQICCILHQFGQKESATLQPFFTLQLDVQSENVKSVQDALEQLVSKESLQGYTCTKSNVEVDATQRTLIEELPPVLVLHLKWFHYDKNGGLQKRIKQVDFDIDLEISKDLLSPHAKSRTQPGQRKYKLFAVVSHIGARAIGGHYVVDIFHPGYNCWLRCDDNNISSIPTTLVTKFTTPKVPYLIFYRCFEKS